MANSNKHSEIKIENVCRTCLSKDNDLHSVFDVSISSVSMDYVIAEITGISIIQTDGLPSKICDNCKERASLAYEFRKQSQEANSTLLNWCEKDKEAFTPQEDYKIESQATDIKTEETTNDDNNFVDWIEFDDLNDIGAVKSENEEGQHQCKSCGLLFKTNDELQEHDSKKCLKVEVEDGSNNHCPLCGTSYYDAVKLNKHMWESHADIMGPKKRGRPKKYTLLSKLSENGFNLKTMSAENYVCYICKEQPKNREELRRHMFKHKDTRAICCIFCKKMYLNSKFFNVHICVDEKGSLKKDDITQKNDNGKFKQCYQSEILLEELVDNSLIMICEICTAVFTSENDLMIHNDTEHPERSLRCNMCLKVFASVKSASRHRSICKQVERKHKCTTCGLKFAYEISLNKHILRYHEGQSVSVKFMDTKAKDEGKQYQCDTCNKQFSRKELLAKHTRTHSEKLYECDICKKKFNRSDNLRSHKRTHDPREKTKASTCLCLYCGRSFNNSSNLIVHMRRHTGEKPYKCDFCGKGFPRSSDLQCHRRSHTGEKPCVCRVCGKGFSRSNKLSRHMRVHTGLKPYKCTYCEKAFSQSNDLTLHIRRHTGDKPYICELCGDRFIQGTALHNHRRTHGHFPPSSSNASQGQGIYTIQNIVHPTTNT